MDQGCLPTDWKQANIVPLHKKDDKSKVSNYRPISLTSITSKLLEHIVHSNIINFLEDHSILSNIQHGFRKNRSCESQLITTIRDFANCLNNKQQVDAILLDFSKAFDKVDHLRLLQKLHKYGIRNNLHQWISSFLLGRQQTVLVEGKSSNSAPVASGVPQGTVLGPLLFLIYINDIDANLSKNTKLRLFADDSFLYRTIKSPSDSIQLQKDLEMLQIWEKHNKTEFHPDKCKVIRFTNKIKFIHSKYKIHNIVLEEQNSAKYLGVTLNKNLSWNDHCHSICKKASSTLAFIQRNLHSCPSNVKETCYKTLVRPILEYGCSVWDPHHKYQIEMLEKIQKRAARFVTNNYTLKEGNTKKNMLTLGWQPLSERRAKTKVLNLYKALNGSVFIPTDDLKVLTSRTRSGEYLSIPHSSVDSHLFSFYPNTIRLWNSIPTTIKATSSPDSFKASIQHLTLRSAY